MVKLRLMADYECYPIWDSGVWDSGEGEYNVNPRHLPIPIDLADELIAWGDEFTATLNREYPPWSGFPDEQSAEGWLRRGAELAERIRLEGVEVDYWHEGHSASELVADSND